MGQTPVFDGGPILHNALDDSLLVLHQHGSVVPESTEIAPQLFLGGSLGTVLAVDESKRRHGEAAGLRIFNGFSAWSLTQLEIELERGVWIHTRAECPSATAQLCLGMLTGESAWRAALEAARLPALARFPRGPHVDATLRGMVELHQRRCAEEMVERLQQKA
eukprot:3236471-Amphidinium_carterae.1